MGEGELKYSDILRNLDGAIDDVLREDPEAKKEILRAAGHDEGYLTRGLERIAAIRARERRRVRVEARKEFVSKFKQKVREIGQPIEEAESRLAAAGVMFREGGKLERSDVQQLLKDTNMLEEFKRAFGDEENDDQEQQ